MSTIDLLIIIAEGLPVPQALDLLTWWLMRHPDALLHPSFQWWAKRHAGAVSLMLQMRRLEAGLWA